jgi:hypothetical protein
MATIGHLDFTYLHVVHPVLVLGLLTKSKDVLLLGMMSALKLGLMVDSVRRSVNGCC